MEQREGAGTHRQDKAREAPRASRAQDLAGVACARNAVVPNRINVEFPARRYGVRSAGPV
jgi:hypothetical protein